MKKLYESSLGIKLSQSSQRIVIRCSGQGLEPQIELDKQLLEFGPILPHSNGDEKEIVIRNPCGFPVEIYNLEFDKIYLEEEKVEKLWSSLSLSSVKLHFTALDNTYDLLSLFLHKPRMLISLCLALGFFFSRMSLTT